MAVTVTGLEALSDDEMYVLDEMNDWLMDKSRHGELRSEYGFNANQLAAASTLWERIYNEARRRPL